MIKQTLIALAVVALVVVGVPVGIELSVTWFCSLVSDLVITSFLIVSIITGLIAYSVWAIKEALND